MVQAGGVRPSGPSSVVAGLAKILRSWGGEGPLRAARFATCTGKGEREALTLIREQEPPTSLFLVSAAWPDKRPLSYLAR